MIQDSVLFGPLIDSLQVVSDFMQPSQRPSWRSFINAWFGFGDWRLLVRLITGLTFAVLLTATIAFHPRSYGYATSLEQLEYPKTLFLYSIVGAMIAQVVLVNATMALVVFGIGGLLRFRTNVGAASDTGQVILVTIVGIACGLHQFPLAVVGTAAGWILIYRLNHRKIYEIEVGNLTREVMTEAMDAYVRALERIGCRIMNRHAEWEESRFTILLVAPPGAERPDLEPGLAKIKRELRGSADWKGT